MILGVTIERGYPDDKHSTYVWCDFDSYPKYEGLSGEHPLTKNSIKIYELYNLLERIDNMLLRTEKYYPFFHKKIIQLEDYKKQIFEVIDLLKSTSKPIKDDDECLEGKVKIPDGYATRYIKINTYHSKSEQKLALRRVNKILKN